MKHIWKTILSVILSLLFIYLLYYILKKIGLFEIITIIRTIKIHYLLLSVILVFASYMIWAKKWNMLLKSIGDIHSENVFLTLLASSFAYSTAPSARLGGEPLRVYYVSKLMKKSKTEVLATVLFDRDTETLSTNFLYIISIIIIIFIERIPFKYMWIMLLFLIISISWIIFRLRYFKVIDFSKFKFVKKILQIIYAIRYKKEFQHFSSYQHYISEKVQKYNALYFKFNQDKGIMNDQIMHGILKFVLLSFSVFLLFLSTDTYVSFIAILAIQTISLVISSISFIPGGIGIMEALMIALYYGLGINLTIAASVALLYRAINYFFSFVIGTLCIYYLDKKTRTHKKKIF